MEEVLAWTDREVDVRMLRNLQERDEAAYIARALAEHLGLELAYEG